MLFHHRVTQQSIQSRQMKGKLSELPVVPALVCFYTLRFHEIHIKAYNKLCLYYTKLVCVSCNQSA